MRDPSYSCRKCSLRVNQYWPIRVKWNLVIPYFINPFALDIRMLISADLYRKQRFFSESYVPLIQSTLRGNRGEPYKKQSLSGFGLILFKDSYKKKIPDSYLSENDYFCMCLVFQTSSTLFNSKISFHSLEKKGVHLRYHLSKWLRFVYLFVKSSQQSKVGPPFLLFVVRDLMLIYISNVSIKPVLGQCIAQIV